MALSPDLANASSQAAEAFERLAERAEGRRLVSVTVPVEIKDPSAAIFASRRADDRWFCWEQPDRDGFALAGVGTAAEAISRGPRRFDDVARVAAETMRGRLADEPDELPAAAGPVWVGGFAFDGNGAKAAHWASFEPAMAFIPELAIVRRGERTFLTVSAVAGDEAATRVRARLAALRANPLPLADPHPTGRTAIASVKPPHHYEDAVEAAVGRIKAGKLKKTVLSRDVTVEAPAAHDVAAVYGALRDQFPSCFCFCVGTPEAAFIGASPELLVRRDGAGISTVALAASTRRSADPAVDAHLGERMLHSPKDRSEHDFVARRIERSLRPLSVWVEAAKEPAVIQIANIQHLATPIRAQLAQPRSAFDVAGKLHPTPAVGGEPRAPALEAIAQLEEMDRGWFAAPVGWMDSMEDGELCVALRSALVRDRVAHLYAGAGIVADSDPAAELAETELKLDALLPLLAG
jgi:isochorismate synthase